MNRRQFVKCIGAFASAAALALGCSKETTVKALEDFADERIAGK